MATKQALTLEQIQQQKAEFEKKLLELAQQETSIIEESKAEAYTSLIEVVNKYRLNGIDVINTLLSNRKISFKEVGEVKPIILIHADVKKQKRNAEKGIMEDGTFDYYEGKVILADAQQSEQICANGVESFKATLTEKGKEYLANEETKSILVDFYNKYKSKGAKDWNGQ